jgi:RNA polymerase sigma-70 factor (ECF subfamily)
MSTEQLVEEHQRRLFGLAYRMLGQVAEAEDAVQEAFLRWTQSEQAMIDNPAGWLTTVVSRICVDRLKSSQHQRETYVGPWLPEPLVTDDLDPADVAGMADSLNLAFLVVLENLSPVERAAFLLHDVFGYTHEDVGAMLERSPTAVRQLVSRARGHLAQRRPRYERDAVRRQTVATEFIAAAAGADLARLMAVLSPDVTFVADGGGLVPAARHPLYGRQRVTQVILQLAKLAPPGYGFDLRDVNSTAGVVITRHDGTTDSVWILGVADEEIVAIHVIRNPHKLRAFDEPAQLPAGEPPE